MLGPMSMDGPSSEDDSCLEKNHGSKGERVASRKKPGRLSCWMPILATLLGNNFCTTSGNWMTTGPGVQKSTEEPCGKGLRSCKGSSCVAPAADAWAFAINAMARC